MKILFGYITNIKKRYHTETQTVFYYLHLYSLTLFEFNYLTPQQQETFFEPLKPFSIYLDDKKLTLHEIMVNMVKYDNFLIKKSNGQIISRRQKEDLLEKVLTSKHFLIEEKYNNIESEWPDVVVLRLQIRKRDRAGAWVFIRPEKR